MMIEQPRYFCGKLGTGLFFSTLLGRLYRKRMTGELLLKQNESPKTIFVEKEEVLWRKPSDPDEARSELLSLFQWTTGLFTFWPEAEPPPPGQAFGFPTVELILEGAKQINDITLLEKELHHPGQYLRPSTNTSFSLSTLHLSPVETHLLSRLDGRTSLPDIVKSSPTNRKETLVSLHGLFCVGLVETSAGNSDTRSFSQPERRHQAPSGPPPPVQKSSPPHNVDAHIGEEEKERNAILEKHESCCNGKTNYYTILEIDQQASGVEITVAFQQLTRTFNLSRCQRPHLKDLTLSMSDLSRKINEAYATLKDATKREAYDKTRSTALRAITSRLVDASDEPSDLARDHCQTGLAFYEREDYHNAIQLFRMAIMVDKKNGEYHLHLGRALAKNPHWRKKAVASLQKATDLDPRNAEAHLQLGRLYKDTGMLKRARACFEKALDINPVMETAQRELDTIS